MNFEEGILKHLQIPFLTSLRSNRCLKNSNNLFHYYTHTLQFQIIVPPRLLVFVFFVGPPPLINFPDFVLQIFQRLLKRIVLFAKL